MAKFAWFCALALLGGCFHSDPGPDFTSTVSGVVEIDSRVENALVFVDRDDNDLFEGEPHAFTDADGHFSITYDDFTAGYSIVAIVSPSSTRAGVTDANASYGYTVHLRAALPVPEYAGFVDDHIVLSPLGTVVYTEQYMSMISSPDDITAEVSGWLTASQLPFSGQPLDVTSDYATDTSPDAQQLRFAAGSIAAVLGTAVTDINSVQTDFDCNDAEYYNYLVYAMDSQLTTIANGANKFLQLSSDVQLDIQQHPGNYLDFFFDTASLKAELESSLESEAVKLAEAAYQAFIEKFAEDVISLVAGELFAELLG